MVDSFVAIVEWTFWDCCYFVSRIKLSIDLSVTRESSKRSISVNKDGFLID